MQVLSYLGCWQPEKAGWASLEPPTTVKTDIRSRLSCCEESTRYSYYNVALRRRSNIIPWPNPHSPHVEPCPAGHSAQTPLHRWESVSVPRQQLETHSLHPHWPPCDEAGMWENAWQVFFANCDLTLYSRNLHLPRVLTVLHWTWNPSVKTGGRGCG